MMGIRISKDQAKRLGIDLGRTPRPRGMNRWESLFAAELGAQKTAGILSWFSFEAIKLRLAKGAYYKPDFAVVRDNGHLTFYEVKGFMREAANVRIKVAAEMYPCFSFVIVRRVDGRWTYEEL